MTNEGKTYYHLVSDSDREFLDNLKESVDRLRDWCAIETPLEQLTSQLEGFMHYVGAFLKTKQ